MKKLFFALVSILLIQPVLATKYYFSNNSGNDDRSEKEAQSPSTPWKTIGKLNSFMSKIEPGDEILFKRGEVFFGAITILRSGFEGRPITFSAYGDGAKPIITGLVTLANWIPAEGHKGVYESTNAMLGPTVNILLVNNVLQQLGRYPNVDAPNKGYLTFESHNKNVSITDNELPGAPDWTGAQAVVRRTRWKLDRLPIVSHKGSTLNFKMNFSSIDASLKPSEYDNYGYFIQKDIRTLDKFGEWYFDPSSKKMYVYLGDKSPSLFLIKATSLPNLIYANNNSNLTFNNLAINGGNINGMSINNSKNVTIQNCSITFSGNTGISAEKTSTNLNIINCNISYSNSWGIRLDNSINSNIKDNAVRNSGVIAGMGESDSAPYTGIEFGGSGNVVENNEVDSSGYIGIHLMSGDNQIIKNNVINTYGFIKDDCGAIYTWKSKKSNERYLNRQIVGNIIINGVGAQEGTNSPNPAANGIYIDGANGILVTKNTVANTFRGIFFHNSYNIVATGNTLNNNQVGLYFQQDDGGTPIRNNTINNNVVFSKLSDQVPVQVLFLTPGNDIDSIGILDSNFYYRPANDKILKLTFKAENGKNVNQSLTLDDWRNTHQKDFASKLVTFKTNNNPNNDSPIIFEYNSSQQNKSVNLDGTYKDLHNNLYKNKIVIKPYSSIILLKQQANK